MKQVITNQKHQRISVLVFDLDGTAVPNSIEGMPSKRVIEAVRKAKEKIFVSIATGRPISYAQNVIDALGITSPSIFAGGSIIYDPKCKTILSKKIIDQKVVKKIIEYLNPFPYKIYFSDADKEHLAREVKTFKDENVIFIDGVDIKQSVDIQKELRRISSIVVHKADSWHDDLFTLHITHRQATKQHAMQKLLKLLSVPKNEVLAVGDSYNDLPLLESAGFKVAMGNGSEELKEKADYVAPSVDEDGLAQVIEKFILT